MGDHFPLKRTDPQVNKAKNFGATPLIIACQKGHLEIVQKLLERNEIEVNQTTKNRNTAFTISCLNGHLEVAKKLIEYPDTDFTTYGKLALRNASKKGHDAIVDLLQNHDTEK